MIKRIRLFIEYDGSGYSGWQIQPDAVSIQEEIEKAILKITCRETRIYGAGRTDAQVHAMGQVAHFDSDYRLSGDRYARALNSVLPRDISVRYSDEVDMDFHAQYSAKGKVYRYEVDNSKNRPALDRVRAWWMKDIIYDDLLKEGEKYFSGTHNFTSFTDGERSDRENVRTIHKAEWTRVGNKLIFEIEGNGFLYKMVRIIAGTLIDVGRGKIPPQSIPDIIKAENRKIAGQTAPAYGLYLVKVLY